ncbi:hypothetical protein K435DRAFT_563900, partial [Dendrothele bispora CBS 962.96]
PAVTATNPSTPQAPRKDPVQSPVPSGSNKRPFSPEKASFSGKPPSWLKTMKSYLTQDLDGKEGAWKALWEGAVESLVSLEASYHFQDSRKSLPTSNRPGAIQAWVKNARKDRLPVTENDPMTFGNAVLDWWNSLQPDWRGLDQEGMVDILERAWLKEVEGQWGKLRCPGINGLSSIMACLRWWLDLNLQSGKGMPGDEWHVMLEDVVWVMDCLAQQEEEPPTKKHR